MTTAELMKKISPFIGKTVFVDDLTDTIGRLHSGVTVSFYETDYYQDLFSWVDACQSKFGAHECKVLKVSDKYENTFGKKDGEPMDNEITITIEFTGEVR